MKTISVLGLMVALTWLGTGSAGAEGVQSIFEATLAEPNQKTTEVSTEELRRILVDGAAAVFDARPTKEYALSHIPGALNVAGKPGVPMSQYVPDASEIARALGGQQSAPIVLQRLRKGR